MPRQYSAQAAKRVLCLGIESSCDDTSLALVRDGVLIDQVTSSQVSVHALFGGVVPELASREHARLIGPLCDFLLRKAGVAATDIDTVAVARGPGLLGSLLVGVAFAKAFAFGTSAQLIGVPHLHAHLMVVGLEDELAYPALGLLVSGGHTHLYRIESPTEFFALGCTLDDAAGEAFDKAGKMLGLPYPAGKYIDVLANEGTPAPKLFPRPYVNNDTVNFSFSGLKTAMATYLQAHPDIPVQWSVASGQPDLPSGAHREKLANVCASYRLAVVETLVHKTKKALALPAMQDCKTLVLAGGVAANSLLREYIVQLGADKNVHVAIPSPVLCTDNGAMIAYLGWKLASMGYTHTLDLSAIPRGQKLPDDMRYHMV